MIPYRREFVPQYHSFMQDPLLLKLTGSEPMTLEEELNAQKDWIESDSKLTWLIVDPSQKILIGDLNFFFSLQQNYAETDSVSDSFIQAEINIMICNSQFRRKGIARQALFAGIQYCLEYVVPFFSMNPPSWISCKNEYSNSTQTTSDISIPKLVFAAHIDLDNTPSISLFKSISFSFEKTVKVFHESIFRLEDKDFTCIFESLPLKAL